jgi:hypothetical protein
MIKYHIILESAHPCCSVAMYCTPQNLFKFCPLYFLQLSYIKSSSKLPGIPPLAFPVLGRIEYHQVFSSPWASHADHERMFASLMENLFHMCMDDMILQEGNDSQNRAKFAILHPIQKLLGPACFNAQYNPSQDCYVQI